MYYCKRTYLSCLALSHFFQWKTVLFSHHDFVPLCVHYHVLTTRSHYNLTNPCVGSYCVSVCACLWLCMSSVYECCRVYPEAHVYLLMLTMNMKCSSMRMMADEEVVPRLCDFLI